jgi:hypothetical protein
MAGLEGLLRQGTARPDQLESEVEGWILGLPSQSSLKQRLREADENWLQDKYKKYVSVVTTEAATLVNTVSKLYTAQIDTLKTKGALADYDPKIMGLIAKEAVPAQFLPSEDLAMKSAIIQDLASGPLLASSVPFRSAQFSAANRTTVQIPVQDTRTKALIQKLASEMRRLCTKYPKLASEISPELSEYFSQEILDVIEVDELDRLVEIVKYKPEIVKVENTYTLSNSKSRRVEFHLKVLIKALLEEMEKMKRKTGV